MCSAISSAPRDRVLICNSPVCYCNSPPHTFTFHTDVLRQGRIHPIIPGDGEGPLFHFSGSDTCCFQVKKLIMWDHLRSSGRLSARARADYSNSRWAPRSLQIKEEHTSTSETSETRLQASFQKPVFPTVAAGDKKASSAWCHLSSRFHVALSFKTHWGLSHQSWKPNESINTASF